MTRSYLQPQITYEAENWDIIKVPQVHKKNHILKTQYAFIALFRTQDKILELQFIYKRILYADIWIFMNNRYIVVFIDYSLI